MDIKFNEYEKSLQRINNWEYQKRELEGKREQAQKAVEDAKREVNRIVAQAASDNQPGAVQAISEAQAAVMIAEERLRQTERELDAYPKKPPQSDRLYSILQGDIAAFIRSGEGFQPVLDRMAERQRQQMEDYRLLMTMKRDINDELQSLQNKALGIQRQHNGGSSGGSPLYVDNYAFRPWIFVHIDYQNATFEIEKSVKKPVPEPPIQGNKSDLPEQPCHVGQHEIGINSLQGQSVKVIGRVNDGVISLNN